MQDGEQIGSISLNLFKKGLPRAIDRQPFMTGEAGRDKVYLPASL